MPAETSRRLFLRDSLLVTAGAAAGTLLPGLMQNAGSLLNTAAAQEDTSSTPEQRLEALGITLPPAPAPVAVYRPAVVSGNMLYASGHGPRGADGELLQGRVGEDLTLQEGYDAARLVGLNVLSTLRDTLGRLDKVARLVKVLGMVNCTADFKQHPQVINGFSELMVQVFGEQHGKAARSAVGMGSLPGNIPVEIEAIFEIRT